MKIIEKLSTYAALIGVVGAIGGGFYTWGQFNTRLDAIEATPSVDLSPLVEKDKELAAKIDDALLYANEYKVDLIDRIKKVDDKITPVDLTKVFKEMREELLPEWLRMESETGLFGSIKDRAMLFTVDGYPFRGEHFING